MSIAEVLRNTGIEKRTVWASLAKIYLHPLRSTRGGREACQGGGGPLWAGAPKVAPTSPPARAATTFAKRVSMACDSDPCRCF